MTVRSKNQRVNRSCVSFEGHKFLTAIDVPKLHRPIQAARGQGLAVGSEGAAKSRLSVAGKAGALPTPGDVPELEPAMPITCYQDLPVRTEGGRAYAHPMP